MEAKTGMLVINKDECPRDSAVLMRDSCRNCENYCCVIPSQFGLCVACSYHEHNAK